MRNTFLRLAPPSISRLPVSLLTMMEMESIAHKQLNNYPRFMDTLRQTRNLGITKAKNKISKNILLNLGKASTKNCASDEKCPSGLDPPLPPKCALRACLFCRQVFNIKRNEGSFLISYLSYLSKLPDTHKLPVRECRDILPIYKVPQMKQEIVMCKVQCISHIN